MKRAFIICSLAFGIMSCNHAADKEKAVNAETAQLDSLPVDSVNSVSNKPATNAAENIVYTCTVHPEVISAKPGKCPKCGKDLVVKK